MDRCQNCGQFIDINLDPYYEVEGVPENYIYICGDCASNPLPSQEDEEKELDFSFVKSVN